MSRKQVTKASLRPRLVERQQLQVEGIGHRLGDLEREERRLGRFGTSSAALHMKAIVFDRKSVFVGSMNLDGRSEQYNTEVGVMIRSSTLTRELMSLVDFESSSYRVEPAPDGQLQRSRSVNSLTLTCDR